MVHQSTSSSIYPSNPQYLLARHLTPLHQLVFRSCYFWTRQRCINNGLQTRSPLALLVLVFASCSLLLLSVIPISPAAPLLKLRITLMGLYNQRSRYLSIFAIGTTAVCFHSPFEKFTGFCKYGYFFFLFYVDIVAGSAAWNDVYLGFGIVHWMKFVINIFSQRPGQVVSRPVAFCKTRVEWVSEKWQKPRRYSITNLR